VRVRISEDEKMRKSQQSLSGKELIGKRLRITTHRDAPLSPNKVGGEYHDGVVLSVLQNAAEGQPSLVLLDLEEAVAARESFRDSLPFPLRYLVLTSRWKYPIDAVLDGYWVEVDPFALPQERIDSLREPIDASSVGFLKPLSFQMCYLAPSGRDPYMEDTVHARLLESRPAEPQRYGKESVAECYEILIETLNHGRLLGYSRSRTLAQIPSGSSVEVTLELVNCSKIFPIDTSSHCRLRKLDAAGRFTYEAVGDVCAMWWPGGNCLSIRVNDLMLRIDDNLRKRKSLKQFSMGDRIDVVGELEV